ncbi:MAG: 50S ribosomal protein L2 [Candidatus Magasanikbacteria bacterium RIFCSPHIGHO2_01_FULL_41_23]|uniref:Large ribosomal subunit protein uL2 n=1 Tax=Candidatus Magasanikbacteria bacterium RIFCSPLOWO2_01_FULL_40_15 TaxID=1798686 RepID=A0A1F6N295_9BACT|nr:MAG: 50S ribosomal protein L2 [Candidatus Magasanikbacteria bacterium RIFCSPHIGHO2_01_FULL_41_23]OGH66815.1 MAG: 50S ribosomal protein L2 [Candidatus Magasanikbacteria bacterium RIFCSPHIGHO2_02_FULL_41_35]OGH76665.1 MAG: 50S ribosomal protein L2 [Candidatus Magasanikbacteria bacterium RIFCSPHIGHO2_12_FULL_41_16]OGH78001.1 MAG: 50S ribosomal protein L2 [Candidatus Magasanikbacteria bacterium RIFCSPLOWO2_01_FULL_40_15]
MSVKLYKPTTNGRRQASASDFSDLTVTKPFKPLVRILKKHSGRNNQGIITIRHRGGGVKRLYRMIDFKQTNFDVFGTVATIEYDPNRGARVALIDYENDVKSYIIVPQGLKVGDKILSSQKAIEPNNGSRMPLEFIPTGLFVFNIELTPGKGGQLVRGAGVGAQLQTIEGRYAQIKMPSGEVRLILKECLATVGQVGNSDHKLIRLGKAGRMRLKGWRPVVRGKVMNPVDHPHGGGEGRNPIGLKGGPKTKWGKKAMGVKSRRNHLSDKLIIERRKKRKK